MMNDLELVTVWVKKIIKVKTDYSRPLIELLHIGSTSRALDCNLGFYFTGIATVIKTVTINAIIIKQFIS